MVQIGTGFSTGLSDCVTFHGVQDSSVTEAECPGSGQYIALVVDGWLELAEVQVFKNPAATRSVDPVEFQAFGDPLSWGNAESSCTLLGGHLASVHSNAAEKTLATMAQELLDQLPSSGDTSANRQSVWIGLNDISAEAGCDGDAFVWSDGTENDWSGFAHGEPNDWSGEGQQGADHCDEAYDGADPTLQAVGPGGDSGRSCAGRLSCDFSGHQQWLGSGVRFGNFCQNCFL